MDQKRTDETVDSYLTRKLQEDANQNAEEIGRQLLLDELDRQKRKLMRG